MDTLSCPHCSELVTNDPRLAGQVVGCPHCQGQMKMPEAPEAQRVNPIRRNAADTPFEVRTQPAVSLKVTRHLRKKGGTEGLLAALLSVVFPGLGQLCQGRAIAGLGFMFAVVVLVIPAFLWIGFALPALGVWLWAVVDAAMN